jgi:hypothetical protein
MPNHQNPQHNNDIPSERPMPTDPDWQKGYVPFAPPPPEEPAPGTGYVPHSPPPEPAQPVPPPEPQNPSE